MTNKQVINRWITQKFTTGKSSNGNLHFECVSLFSYRTEIARFIESKAIYTSVKYSITTTSKHQNPMRMALLGIESYEVDFPMKQVGKTFADVLPLIEMTQRENLIESINKLTRCKKYHQLHLYDAENYARAIIRLNDEYYAHNTGNTLEIARSVLRNPMIKLDQNHNVCA